tara:strand:- start:888 stop:1859 length:972 start_codon:yes stop_codon:yes gene_type:complete
MLISVVLTFYNQAVYVRRALLSVLQQTHKELDVVIVDDGSDEDIEREVRQFPDERIRFFRKENGGAASARNYGIDRAMSPYIAFLDGDDVFLPERIRKVADVITRGNFPVGIITCGSCIFSEKTHRFRGRTNAVSYQVGDLIDSTTVRPSSSVYHSDIFKTTGGFPEHMKSNEDGALNSVAAQYFPIMGMPEHLVLYQLSSAGLARRDLEDYQTGVNVLYDRLDFVLPHLSADLKTIYKNESQRNLLKGFLSGRNLAGAVAWYREIDANILTGALSDRLAVLSVKSGINFYSAVRCVQLWFRYLWMLPVQKRYRRFLGSSTAR